MNVQKNLTRLITLKQLQRDLLNQDLPNDYRNKCRNEYLKRLGL
tara:strand:- start:1687 stop:1818 length:132 start_codon:yes stop_codon:yes gene_type:complete